MKTMNSYKKGYLKELEAKRILKRKKKFHTVFRATSTHSPFDIVAISSSKILLLQVKSGKFSMKKELERLKAIKVPGSVQKQLWYIQKSWKVVNC
jgi:Holliday junction resolvase